MIDHPDNLERFAADDLITAERRVREVLAKDPTDTGAVCLFARILRKSGRAAEAVALLQDGLRAVPGHAQITHELARAQRDGAQFLAAAATFADHARLDAGARLDSLKDAASCLLQAGKTDESKNLLEEIGVLPEGIALAPDAVMAAREQGRLDDPQVVAILAVMAKAQNTEAATLLKLALWDTGDDAKRAHAVYDLPSLLLGIGRVDDAVRVYQKAVDLGLPVGDFRPRSALSTLAAADARLAARLFQQDWDRFNTALARREAVSVWIWTPAVDAWDGVTLRGAVLGRPGEVHCEVRALPPAEAQTWIAAAVMVQADGNFTFWRGAVDSLLAGRKYAIRMIADGQTSAEIVFEVPAVDPDAVVTVPGDNVGVDAVVFAGRAVPVAPEARYRFEYGLMPDRLDQVTEWKALPPPRGGQAYRRVYRQAGEWLPTCVNPGWVHGGGEADARLPNPGLLIGAPFAKDRNQLNGIGAHEMPLGLRWSRVRPKTSGYEGPITWFFGGGVQDFRDAEISFTLCGQQLVQRGAALHFWVSHVRADDPVPFTCQWALTATPFPDDVLEGAVPRKVSLTLPNDPRAWTYTGNNPQEQGARANRYRRVPLDVALSEHNASTVLIFSFGEVAKPPTGGLVFYDAEIRYRDTSVLLPAAETVLTQFPAGRADPYAVTDGASGYEEQLWTSELSPVFPLTFAWALKRPVRPTHFQISQHPYWPAREVQVIAGEGAAQRIIWAGILPEGRPDRSETAETIVYLDDDTPVTTVTLRILSGYRPERCGLDGFQFYGAGVTFVPDGRPVGVSTEVAGFAPGTAVFYRLVMEDGEERLAGDVACVTLPGSQAPVIESATPLVRARNPACYVVRANAMGLETELWGELRQADGRVIAGKRISLGAQPTGRHIYYVPDQIPDVPGEFSLHARNLVGEATLRAPWPCR
ncbi:MAG: tetratricopeptide repeat protein [Rhodospirillaceae bacterium]|nr:tetratricopeptide repeat protein [Rhodospirillaceae bacterium]